MSASVNLHLLSLTFFGPSAYLNAYFNVALPLICYYLFALYLLSYILPVQTYINHNNLFLLFCCVVNLRSLKNDKNYRFLVIIRLVFSPLFYVLIQILVFIDIMPYSVTIGFSLVNNRST